MSLFVLLLRGLMLAGLALATASAEEVDVEKRGVYAQGGWSTLHRGPANRKLVRGVELPTNFRTWTALEGASVLTAPVMSPDGQTLYVTTGRDRGQANLHAFTLEGEALWQSVPWTGSEVGVDPCAVLSSAIVDSAGDLYIGDCNQLFAYHGDGRMKWSVDLPSVREGDWVVSEDLPVNALTTAAFTRDGDVFGVTNFGDLVIFDRETGRSLASARRLPGHVPGWSEVMPRPDSLFGDGLIDPTIVEWAWQLLFGGAMPSANTPAVDLETGRIFVAATSTTPGRGALYGLDIHRSGEGDAARVEIEIAFTTEMGPGSGSSPALSPAGHRVYVSDETGLFYGIDTSSGEIIWTVQTRAASAAVAVGADGAIYALQAFGPALIAIDEAGHVRWESNLEAFAGTALPDSFWLGTPEAIGNGNPTVVEDRVLVPVIYGYETKLFGRKVPWPVRSSLVAVDVATGLGVANVLSLPDDSTGITGVLQDGTVINSLGTAMTSGLTPLAPLAEWLLPWGLSPLRSVGGVHVARPAVGR